MGNERMKLINSIVPIEYEKKVILINGITGGILELEQNEYKRIKNGNINEEETNQLSKNGFLVSDDFDEDLVRKNLFNKINQNKNRSISAVFALTYGCNFGCPYCYEKDLDSSDVTVMDKEKIDCAMKVCGDKVKHITLFGGEPLLPITKEILLYLKDNYYDKEYAIITNGYYLEEFIDILLGMKISYVQVTLDGKEETHNKSRVLKNGGKTYKKIKRGIEACLKNHINLKIRMNITLNNEKECFVLKKELEEEYKKYGKNILFEISPVFQTTNEEKDYLIKKIYDDISRSFDENNALNLHMLTDLPIVNYLLGKAKYEPIIGYCMAHGDKMIFDSNGDIYSCILGIGDKRCSIGTYYPRYKEYEKSIFKRDIFKIEKCRKCESAFLCGGGCPLENIKCGKDIFSSNCEKMEYTKKYLIPYLLKMRQKID